MGFASARALLAHRRTVGLHPSNQEEAACQDTVFELTQGRTFVDGLNAYLRIRFPAAALSTHDSHNCYADVIVGWRGEYSAVLARGPADLANAYNLGVNIGIAEIQASIGEPARQIVVDALGRARSQVSALGLNAIPLEQAAALASSNAPMERVHEQVQAARVTYQSSL